MVVRSLLAIGYVEFSDEIFTEGCREQSKELDFKGLSILASCVDLVSGL